MPGRSGSHARMALPAPRYIPPRTDLDPGLQPASKPVRLALWGAFSLCGLLIGVILFSQINKANELQLEASFVSTEFEQSANEPVSVLNFTADGNASTTSARATTASRQNENARWFMPRDAVRVRRSGILSGN